ncbi:MAG: arabinogalactan endo-1,4-beta-galactosidase [Treponema sp.]|nr:arabinogalactan endo-1,4-beta-galactosidase [Treponema sp.]
MKVLRYAATALMITLISVSCELPKYPAGNEGTTEGLGGGKRTPVLTDYAAVNLAPLSKPVPDDFMRGVDISNTYILEQAGCVFYDHDNNQKDILQIMKDDGVNWIRLRIWNDHQKAYNPPAYAGDGDNDLLKTRAIAKRAKALGMKFFLDFHYSDNWADPGRQQIPYAWRDYNREELMNAVYEYTFDILEELVAAGAAPDMIQIGNEINAGLLKTTNGTGYALQGWDRDFPEALQAASRACRLVTPDAKIALHFADGGSTTVGSYLDYITPRIDGTTGTLFQAVDYDVIGLSWYPYYAAHKSIQEIHDNLKNFKTRYGKETAIFEGAWAWRTNYDGDDMPNLFHIKEEYNTTDQMPQTNQFVWDSGIRYVYGGPNNYSPFVYYYPATPENQARVLRAYFDMIVDAGGSGIFYWAGDWISYPGLLSNWDNQSLFDLDGKALPALRVFGIKGQGQ